MIDSSKTVGFATTFIGETNAKSFASAIDKVSKENYALNLEPAFIQYEATQYGVSGVYFSIVIFWKRSNNGKDV